RSILADESEPAADLDAAWNDVIAFYPPPATEEMINASEREERLARLQREQEQAPGGAVPEQGPSGEEAPAGGVLQETPAHEEKPPVAGEKPENKIEPSALAAFPEMTEVEGGGYPLNLFAPHEVESFKKAGVIYKNEKGQEVVNSEALWQAREELQKLPWRERNRLIEESTAKMFEPKEEKPPVAGEKEEEVVATFKSKEGKDVESLVTRNPETGKYHVSLRDIESGEYLPTTWITDDKTAAIEKAQEWVYGKKGLPAKKAPEKPPEVRMGTLAQTSKIGEIKKHAGGAYSPTKVRLYQELGELTIPGVRLQDAEEAGRLYEALQDRKITKTEWNRFVKQLKKEGKIRKPEVSTEAEAIEAAAAEAEEKPSAAQIEAGNYKKGHIQVSGFDISIENRAGGYRESKPGAPKKWRVKLHDHYGYIRGTTGEDGEPLDVFINPNPIAQRIIGEGPVFVIKQNDPETGKFDEYKVMIGYVGPREATEAYYRNYEKGWTGLGAIHGYSWDEFEEWVKENAKYKAPAKEKAPEKPFEGKERRRNLEYRKRVESMTPEEMREALLTDELTGLGNRRAFEEDPEQKYVAALDVDSLKWVNDNIGHDFGDKLLKAMGEALKAYNPKPSETYRAYHISGDEFMVQGNLQSVILKAMNAANKYLKEHPLTAKTSTGETVEITGAFSY
ncbi:diguanylate cyclase domain-containing protein, partial [Palaeococcus sp. (in: euryarchaeotes)]